MSIRVGVLGAGRIGRMHIKTLASGTDGAELVAVADSDEAAARSAGELAHVPWMSDPLGLVKDPQIDAIVIATPTGSHAELIRLCASSGKHVFCEKPVSLTIPEADDAIHAAAEAGVVLQVGYQRRFDPDYERAREAIASGGLGRLYVLRSTTRDPQPPPLNYARSPLSIFTDTMSHDFDILRWLADDDIVEVSAMAASLVRPEHASRGIVDTTVVTVRFAGGALGAVDNCWESRYGYDVRTEVLGATGMIAIPDLSDAMAGTPRTGTSDQDRGAFFLDRFTVAYAREIIDFVACIEAQRPPRVSGEDARETLRVSLAAAQSVRDGRPVAVSTQA